MKKKVQIISLTIGIVLLIFGCQNIWDEHYDGPVRDLPDYNLYEFIGSNPDLSIFSQMLQKTGYDSILSVSQTFTVWAPVNSALSDIDLNDEENISEIVRNHITRGNYSTSAIQSSQVKMINGKNILFERASTGFTFGKAPIKEANIITGNGQVHILDGYVPYTNNILEFINRTEGLDSLDAYLESQNLLIFDPYNSTEIGFDSAGNVVYDSVFNMINLVLYELGSLGTEDSFYTALLPDNTAWEEAFQRAEPYFNIPDIYGGLTRKRTATQWAVVQDMVFREQVYDPAEFDSLVSTNGNVFYSPVDIFAGAQMNELSNGIGYVTGQMPFADTSSWYKPIEIEAETESGRENANSNIYVRTGFGSGLDISGDEYIAVSPTGTSNIAQPYVRFSIPNTLSATYNLYCIFVPAYIVDPENMRPNKARFQLTYLSTTTGRTRRETFIPENNVTDTLGLTKMFIGQFNFEFANLIDRDYNEIPVKLQVTNEVTIEEENAGLYSRTMRIDKIVFEPVFE